MSKPVDRHSIFAVLGNLGWPLIFGLAGCSVFYALIFQGPLDTTSMHRYFSAHPVSFCATGMFFVGLAALLLKCINILGQYWQLGRITLGSPPEGIDVSEGSAQLLDRLDDLPVSSRASYLAGRLHDALEFVERKGSAEGLEDELKYLSDMDAGRQQDSYALVRIIIWATPMLGFLGTVIGITQALGNLDPAELANSIQTAMEKLLSGLYIAFDTTALALSLSIVLMFLQFLIDRIETQLLAAVDEHVLDELAGRFEQVGAQRDPHLQSIQRSIQAVTQSTEDLVTRQAQLWQSTIETAHARWAGLADATGEQMQKALAGALDECLQKHARRLAQIEKAGAEKAQQRWEQWQMAMSANARKLHAQQVEMTRQSELMAQVIQSTGDVIRLEQALNDNLRMLGGAKNFEDTVMSLSAAIHLLNTRLEFSPDETRRVELTKTRSEGRAA